MQPKRDVLTIAQAAERLGVSQSTAYLAAKTGEIPAIRIRRRWVVPKVRFEQMLREKGGSLAE